MTAAVVLLFGAISQPLIFGQQASVAAQGSDGTGAFYTGKYRNLLAEAGHKQSEIDGRIQKTFKQLFHGDSHSETIFYLAGRNADGPLAYVTDVANHDVRTEGMSYGMMIAVQTDHKAEFDALWNWANTYMLITDPENPSEGYYAWSMNLDGSPRSDSAAPDGEEYFVMSLYFAANRWGNGSGLYNYREQADKLLRVMRHHPMKTGMSPFRVHPGDKPFISGRTPHRVTIGPMVDDQRKMIYFVPGSGVDSFTDPSYQLPHFYELWSRWGPAEDREFWAQAAVVSRRFFMQATNPRTGLAPDYANFDGTPRATSFNRNSATFSNDAWRTASNWSVDQIWWGKNPEVSVLSDRLQGFFYAQGVHDFRDQYTTSGESRGGYHSSGVIATTAVSSLVATDPKRAKEFVQELWSTPIPEGQYRYYNGVLYMLSLLHTSGQFRIWGPVQSTP